MREKPLSPLRAIRKHCLSCAGRPKDVRLCLSKDCSLYRFRMGTNPARSGIGGKIGSPVLNQMGIPSSASISDKNNEKNKGGKGMDKALSASTNLGQKTEEIEVAKVIMVKTGTLQIQESAEQIVVTITKE